MTTVAVDAMGGDRAPGAIVEGALGAARDFDVDVSLVGPEDTLRRIIGKNSHPRVNIVNATQAISVDEHPVQALKSKKDSTISVGLSLVRHAKADAFVSAGSTGALLAGGLLTLGRIKGIDRPALTVILPGVHGKPFMILDVGANTDTRVRNLREFAIMGSVYADKVLGINSPRVALLNIGTEESKGSEQVKQAHGVLKQSSMNFVGNIEARDLFGEVADVIVCDGFVGNVALKAIEGLASTMFAIIKEEISRDLRSKVGAMLVRPYLKRVALRLDYAEYGGAPLLGLAAPCIKCHGSSDSRAIRNGIRVALQFAKARVSELVGQALNNEESASR